MAIHAVTSHVRPEHRHTRDIVIHLTRLFAGRGGDWTADARLFRVAVDGGPAPTAAPASGLGPALE